MMSPEMVRAAAEAMKNMRPEDLASMQQQMQSMTPEQMQRMMATGGMGGMGGNMGSMGGPGAGPSPTVAAEMMKNMRPEDLQFLARQVESMPPEQLQRMAQMAQQGGAGGVPGFNPAGFQAQAHMLQQRQQYELSAAKALKDEGNKLHGAGQYAKAAEKYERARKNLEGHSSTEAAAVKKACALNLMSCNLKLEKYADAVLLGDEIVSKEGKNLKALYRRGQAYAKLGKFKLAVEDLSQAAELAPEDETLAAALREAQVELSALKDEGKEKGDSPGAKDPPVVTTLGGVTIEDVTEEDEKAQSATAGQPPATGIGSGSSPFVPQIDPNAVRASMAAFTSLPPEQVAAMSGGKISPEMAAMASQMMSSMGPEGVQRMMELAARFGPALGAAAPGQVSAGRAQGSHSGGASASSSSSSSGGGAGGRSALQGTRSGQTGASAGSAGPGFVGGAGVNGFPSPINPMEDPETVKAMAEMMKGISPEDLAAMSEKMGQPMTVEQARQTKEIMNKLGPDTLAAVAKWSSKGQKLWAAAKQKARWLVRQRTLLVAILVVLVAVLGRWLGYF